MSIINKLKFKVLWKNGLYTVGMYFLFFIFIVISLRIYTHHGKSFPVPDFKGLTMDRVEQIAKSKDLRVKLVDSTFVAYLPKGSIIDQHPLPGINVKKNRTIFLTINAFSQAKVEMPKVVGFSFRQGKSMLEARGLKVGKLIYKPDFAENNILEQQYKGENVNEGIMIEKGQAIDLVLGNGLGKSSSPIPDLFKLPYQRAVNEINDGFFNVGKVYFDESVKTYNDTLNAMVFKQRPLYSKKGRAVMGSTIDIWLSVDMQIFQEADSVKNL